MEPKRQIKQWKQRTILFTASAGNRGLVNDAELVENDLWGVLILPEGAMLSVAAKGKIYPQETRARHARRGELPSILNAS